MSGSSGSSRRTFKDQVHVKGKYGVRTVRRKDDPDVGLGKVHAVLTFDGVAVYNDDNYFGNISVDEDVMDKVESHLQGRVKNLEAVTLVKGDSNDD